METKPYSIQSPEDIAKDYGGNKQKIAQAMQLGVVDPTAGVLAGMFIDRMRSAQMQEMAPKPSVAQQVMGGPPAQAPLAQAGGLGGTQPAMPPMAPQDGMGPPPMAPPPQGMAAGGMFEAPYMKDGGLSELPIPDGMFDENRDGGYAHGGIVAFPTGGEVKKTEDIEVTAPSGRYGLGSTFEENIGLVSKYAPQKDVYGKKLTAMYEDIMSPEAQKKRRKQDMWTSLAELGFGIASSKSPTLLGAIGEAGAKSAPAMAERAKERRAEQRDAVKTLAQQENMSNQQATEAFKLAGELQKAYGGFMDAEATRKLQERMNAADNATRIAAQKIAAGAQIAAARMNKEGYLGAAQKQLDAIDKQARQAAFAAALKSMAGNDRYRQAVLKGDTAAADALLTPVFNTLYNRYKNAGGAGGGTGGAGEPPLPDENYVIDQP
jgi:hypothetical protein